MDHDQWPDPTPRADPELRRERTGIYLRGKAGPLEGEMEVRTESEGSTPAATAMTMLLVVTAAFLSGGLATLIFWVAHVSGLALAFAGVGAFAAVFVACTILVFRRPAQTAMAVPPRAVIIQPGHENGAPANGTGKAVQPARRKGARNGSTTQVEGAAPSAGKIK
jgi:hypothetical protein